jgi:hypothetical protein
VIAYTYPLLNILWTLLMFAGIVIVIFLIIWALIDNFTRQDHSGWAKAGWCIVIVFSGRRTGSLIGSLRWIPKIGEGRDIGVGRLRNHRVRMVQQLQL